MRRKILLRNLFFLLGSWISAGTQNVITQLYFKESSLKEYFVAITLLVGAVGSMLGIYISKRFLNKKTPFMIAWLLFFNISFTFQYFTQHWLCYIVAHGLTLCLYNGIYNYIDYSFISCTPKEGIDWHSSCQLFYQMLGYTFAPLFFTALETHKGSAIGIMWLVIVTVMIVDVPILLKHMPQKEEKRVLTSQQLTWSQHLFLAYCILVQIAISLMLAEVIYVMSDYYDFINYGFVGSCYLGVMVLVASSVIMILSRAQGDAVKLRGKMQIAGLGCLAGSVLLLLLRGAHHIAYIVIGGILGGVGYGIYMRLSRDYVVKSSRLLKNGIFLTRYNSAQIIASIMAYSISLIIQLVAHRFNQEVIPVILTSGIGFIAMGAIILVILEKGRVGGENRAAQDHAV